MREGPLFLQREAKPPFRRFPTWHSTGLQCLKQVDHKVFQLIRQTIHLLYGSPWLIEAHEGAVRLRFVPPISGESPEGIHNPLQIGSKPLKVIGFPCLFPYLLSLCNEGNVCLIFRLRDLIDINVVALYPSNHCGNLGRSVLLPGKMIDQAPQLRRAEPLIELRA